MGCVAELSSPAAFCWRQRYRAPTADGWIADEDHEARRNRRSAERADDRHGHARAYQTNAAHRERIRSAQSMTLALALRALDRAQYRRRMLDRSAPGEERVRAAEIIAALCLATDLATGLPFEHGLHSTLVAMRLAKQLRVDPETASQTYYACLLFYAGCTADAELSAELFPNAAALATHFTPVMFGSPLETMSGVMRALADPDRPAAVRTLQMVWRLPRALSGHQRHIAAMCEVAQMLTDRLGLPASVQTLFVDFTERWDSRHDQIPLSVRIVHVARDAAFQHLLGGTQHAVRVVRERAGHAFDPQVATCLVDNADHILAPRTDASAWDDTLSCEPHPRLMLAGDAIGRAIAAIGDFADLISPYLVGHSSGVADLATDAGRRCGFDAAQMVALRRAALVHDVGRVAIPTRVWQKPQPLTADEWERIRLHAYHTERVLSRSPFLAALTAFAGVHHERLDGSGYHRAAAGASLPPAARVLAAADAYHAMTEPRPHRQALSEAQASDVLTRETRAGRLDPDAVSAVLAASGQPVPHVERPAGLSEREAEVVGLLARGLLTKQIAHELGISVKTADRHVQNAYGKIGVSTRAAATLFAMEHGLVGWGELPIGRTRHHA
jgi:HD-GYP domain-containing protein (c-di-GMP phosphodiesterase class II)